MITNKTIKSKYQPKQTNVTWVDLNGKTPVEKHFINGKWREISGGSSGSTSNVLWPAMYEDNNGDEIMATFVPEDVEPNTWCMVYGNVEFVNTCLPVLIKSFGRYTICSSQNNYTALHTYTVDGGELLQLTKNEK